MPKEEKSIYERYRESTKIAIISTSLCIVFVMLGYHYLNKYDAEHAEKIYIEQKYKLLEEDYLKLQSNYKEAINNE